MLSCFNFYTFFLSKTPALNRLQVFHLSLKGWWWRRRRHDIMMGCGYACGGS